MIVVHLVRLATNAECRFSPAQCHCAAVAVPTHSTATPTLTIYYHINAIVTSTSRSFTGVTSIHKSTLPSCQCECPIVPSLGLP